MLLLKNGAKLDKRQKRNKKTGVTTKQKEKIDALSPPPLVCIKVTKRKKSAFNSFWIRSLFFCHIPGRNPSPQSVVKPPMPCRPA